VLDRRGPGAGGVSWEVAAPRNTARYHRRVAGGGPGAVACVDELAAAALYGRSRLIAARGDRPSLRPRRQGVKPQVRN
jgi:hypothetical protein